MEYRFPNSIDEAVLILAEALSARVSMKIVAGGTDLAVQIADGVLSPRALLDITRIPELNMVTSGPEGLRIGSAVTMARLSSLEGAPRCLVQGAIAVGSPQIRNLGTLGGNVCNASPCGDTLAPLIALGARLELRSPSGTRLVDAERFFTAPKKTVLREDEILTAVLIDPPSLGGRSAFRMIGKRNGQAISQVNVAVWASPSREDGAIGETRVAFGSVAPTPLRTLSVENLLRGEKPSGGLFTRLEPVVRRDIAPISDVRGSRGYRFAVAFALLNDALVEALGMERRGAQ